MGLSVFYRYAGFREQNEPPARVRELVTQAMDERARLLGAAFRVAHLISAARPGAAGTHFRSRRAQADAGVRDRLVDLVADRVGSRFKQLAVLGRSGGSCDIEVIFFFFFFFF